MNAREIVEALGRERRVERMIQNITRSHTLTPDLQDLAQIVYLALLEYDEDKVVDLWETDSLNFFLARIIMNQWRSSHSPFRDSITKFRSLSEEIRDFQKHLHR